MAEKLLKVKGVFDPGDVQTGLQALTANMRDMGKAALEVGGSKDAWAALGQSIEKMRPDLANVATVAYETAKAMDGIGRSGANFTQIEAGVSKASGYLKILKDAMQEAEKAGVDIGPKVKASIETMEQGIAGAAAKAKVLRESFQGAVPPETAKNVDALSAALDRMEKSADSPKTLMRAAVAAKIELDEMRESAERLGQVTPQMAQRFADAESKINDAAGKARVFADAAGDLATRGNLAAQGMEAMAGRAGSVEGVLGLMKDTGGKAAQTLADIGFSVIAANQALELGKKALDAYKQGLKDMEAAVDGWAKRQADAKNQSELFAAAQTAVSKGLIEAGKSSGETAARYQSFIENTLRASKATDEFATKLAGLKAPESMAALEQRAVSMNTALANAFREGGDRFQEFARLNDSGLKEIAERYERLGKTVPEYIAKAIKANEDAAKAEEKFKKAVEDGKSAQEDKLKAMSEVWTKQQEAIKAGEEIVKQEKAGTLGYNESKNALKEIAAQYGLTEQGLRDLIEGNKDYVASVKEAHGIGSIIEPETLEMIDQYIAKLNELEGAQRAASNAATQHQQILNDLNNAMVTNGASGRGLAEINDAMATSIQNGQKPVVQMKMLMIQLTEATKAQVDALYEQVEAFKEIENQQSKVIDLAAQILSDYQSGQVSIITTLERVAENLRQLYDILGKNMNTPFEAEIRKWIKAFEDLQATLRMGGVQKTEGMRLF